jgi:hypothetical protein
MWRSVLDSLASPTSAKGALGEAGLAQIRGHTRKGRMLLLFLSLPRDCAKRDCAITLVFAKSGLARCSWVGLSWLRGEVLSSLLSFLHPTLLYTTHPPLFVLPLFVLKPLSN